MSKAKPDQKDSKKGKHLFKLHMRMRAMVYKMLTHYIISLK
jgi:hypothetical protein